MRSTYRRASHENAEGGAALCAFIDRESARRSIGMPVEQAYKLATLMDRPGAKDVVLQAAKNLARREEEGGRTPGFVLKALLASLDQSRKISPIRREYNVGRRAARSLCGTRRVR